MPFAAKNKKLNKWGTAPIQDNPYDVDSIQRQLDNTKLRIQDAGFSPKEDSRNWFEKVTNLPEKQNALIDTLELLGRPGQAILNTLDKTKTGQQPAREAFMRGLTGKDKVRGADIAKKGGIENKVGQFLVGTAAEILLDPINLIPGGVIAKGASKLGKGVKAGYNAAENAIPVLQGAREAVTPLAQATKDTLGNMFKYQYKWDKTLAGQSDDTLKKAFNRTQNDIRFQSEEALKNVADVAKITGVEAGQSVGRLMEKGLKQVDEVGSQIPRPVRDMPTDPKVQDAAKMLVKSNTTLRQWALDSGVNVKELEGYMTHVLSAEERKLRRINKPITVDRGNFGAGQPNKNILNTRKLTGSAEDINEGIGRDFFEPNAYFATAIGQKRLVEYVNATKFRREVLSNPDFAVKYEKGMILPKDAKVIDTNNYKFIKEGDTVLEGAGLADEIGGQYVVTKGVKEALDRYQKLTTDEGVKGFLKAFDTAQSAWKRMALFSIPYHLRNDIGAKFNNWVGGMNAADLVKYTAGADKEVYNAIIKGNESKMFQEYRKQGLGASSLSKVEFGRYGEEPEKAIERTIQKVSQFDGTLTGRLKAEAKDLKNPLNVFETSREFGDFVDQTNRFALYKWARDKGFSPEKAADKVREVQFDYTRTTGFEKEIATRFVPFYRWLGNNIPFQIRQFINEPRKYANLNKIRLNAQSAAGINDENVPEWMKENFAIPVSGDGEGSGKFMSLNLPLSDLSRIAEPGKVLVDSLTPLGKLPMELALNRNFFYNKPIQQFEGQEKQFRAPGINKDFGLPIKPAYALEQATGQLGRGLSQYLQRPEDKDQDIKFRTPSLGISSVVKDFDVKKAEYFELLDELKRLQDQIRYIEQQTGQRPRTVNEIR